MLHHEVRTAAGRHASVQQPRDIRVAHPGQDLPLHLEVPEHQVGVHASLQDLDRRMLLKLSVCPLGQTDAAHASLADVGHDLPIAQARAHEGFAQHRVNDEIARLFVRREQGFHFRPNFRVRARSIQIGRALGWLQIQAGIQELP